MKHLLIVFILSAITLAYAQAPQYTMKEVNRVYNSEQYKRDSAYTISIVWPVFDENGPNSSLAQTLNFETRNILQVGTGTVEDIVDSMIAMYQSWESEDDFGVYWSHEHSLSVSETGGKIVSITESGWDYAGGAHGLGFVFYHNYSVETEKKLELSDLLLPGGEEVLRAAAEEIFRKDLDLVGKDLTEQGYWFGEGGFTLNSNFKPETTSITFFYNSYEIAPYAAGPTEITIPYEKFRQVIKKDGPLGFVVD